MKTIKSYKLLEPGEYSPSTGTLAVTEKDVKDFVDAINAKALLGVPTAIVYDHRPAGETIPVGQIRNAVYADGKAYGDIELELNAEVDGKVLSTVDTMAKGLTSKILQGSMEAYKNYKSKAYTGARKFGLWPTAWAILPAGTQPAIPPRIAAGEEGQELVYLVLNDAPEGVESPNGKGADVTIEELSAKLDKLAATVAGLVDGMKQKEASDDGDKEKAEAVKAAEATSDDAVKAAEEAVVIARDLMVARKPEGQREKVLAFVELGESPSAKMLRMKQIDELVPDLELPDGATLKAGEAAPEKGGEEATDEQKAIAAAAADVKAAKVIMREKNVDYSVAVAMVDAEKG